MDVSTLIDDVPRDIMRKNRAQTMEIVEALQAAAAKDDPDQLGHIHIFDLTGLTASTLTRRVLGAVMDMVKISLEHYPGSLETLRVRPRGIDVSDESRRRRGCGTVDRP